MPCFSPIPAFRGEDGGIVFHESRRSKSLYRLDLPCGQCTGCRVDKAQAWANRCVHESRLHKHNVFVTLTYAPEDLPQYGNLEPRDVTLFLKRLRNERGPFRYFLSGEYGDQFSRPHYHALLFGLDFADRKPFYRSASSQVDLSPELDSIWGKGLCSVGSVTPESAGYVCRYSIKKITGKRAADYYTGTDPETGEIFSRVPEFARMSRRPGIGAGFLQRFHSDIYPEGAIVARGGARMRAPRFYDERYAKADPEGFEALQLKRYIAGRKKSGDSTLERLGVRHEVAKARLARLSRGSK